MPLKKELRSYEKFGKDMAVGQNQWYHFGVDALPILVHFSGDWDVHRGYDSDFNPWPHGGTLF